MNTYSSQHQEHCNGRNQNDFLREWMNDEAGKLYHFLGFAHEHGKALSLSLESMNSHSHKKQHTIANTVSSSSVVDENAMADSSCSCAEYARHECMTCGGDGESSGCGSRSSDGNHHDLLSIINAVQNSRYLKHVQQLLNEVVCVSKNSEIELSSDKQMQVPDGKHMLSGGRSQIFNKEMNWQKGNEISVHLAKENQEVGIRMSKLLALLEELDRHQQQYLYQMHALVTSFEDVAGAGAGAAYTTLTSKAMSKCFCNLKDNIIAHINSSKKALYKDLPRNHGVADLHKLNQCNKSKRDAHQCSRGDNVRPVFRPVRGLPEHSVSVLRAFEHFLHPYPNDSEKLMLASRTSLTRNQISNWFINARVRLWKPMIEQMYKEEFVEDQQDSNQSP